MRGRAFRRLESGRREGGRQPLARVIASGAAGVPPQIMGIGPVAASQKALARAGLTIKDMDVIEINEASAAQVLSCLKGLGSRAMTCRVNQKGRDRTGALPSALRRASCAHRGKAVAEERRALRAVSLCIGAGGLAAILEQRLATGANPRKATRLSASRAANALSRPRKSKP